MAIDIGELRGTISLNDAFSGGIKEVSKALGISEKSMKAVAGAASLAAGALVGTTAAIVALGIQGGKVETMEGSFDALSRSVGETSAAMLAATQTATKGLITDMDLMEATNKAILLGLPVTAQEMGTLAESAVVLGRAMGQDATKSLDDLTTALGRSSPLILDNLGLTVSVADANKAYAAELGKSASELTEAEKKTAFYNATVTAAQQAVANLGGVQLTFADRIQQGRVMVTNFVDSLGLAIATSPVVAAGLDSIMTSLQAAFGGSQQDTVKTLMGFVNDFAIGLTYVAQVAVTVAGGFVQAWFGIKTIVLGVITAVSAVGTALVALVTGLAEMGTNIPIVGKHVEGFAAGAKALEGELTAVTRSLAAETAEAARGAAGHSELQGKLDAVGGAIMNVREAMEAAAGAAAGMTEKTGEIKKPIEEVGVAVGLTAAQIKAMEEQTILSMGLMAESWTNAANLQTELQTQIALLQTSGIEQRLLELDNARLAEIAGVQNLAFEYPAQYEVIVAAVTEKYRLMGMAAQGFHTSVIAQARAAGFSTQADLQRTAALAVDTYNRMKDSALFTAEEIRKAWERAEEAKRAATGATTTFTVGSVGQMLTATAGALKAFGVSYKAAAIAGAILSSISAIQKAWASAPFPANLPAVAIVTTATLANILAIRNAQPGFAQGTPDTRFLDFGRVSTVDLHGPEAVVTKTQAAGVGGMVAGMVEDALKAQDARTVEELRGLRQDMADDRRRLPILIRDAALLVNA